MDMIRGSLKNPVARFMFAIGIILVGMIAFADLAIDLFPDITLPIISIQTDYEGASPQDIETTITRPIEKRLSRIQNVRYVSSRSREGASNVTLEFYWGTDLNVASNDVQQAISQILDRFPEDAKQPVIRKFDPSQLPVITLSVSGPMDEFQLRQLAEDFIAPRLETLKGVASAGASGGRIREIQVDVNRDKLEGNNLSLDRITQAVRAGHRDLPGGSLKTAQKEFGVRTLGRTPNIKDIEEIVVTTSRNGVPVRVKDLGRVKDGFADRDNIASVNGVKGVQINVLKQIGGNTVSVVDAILKALPQIQKDVPKGVTLQVVSDQSTFIRKSIKNLQHEAIIGALMAVAIILIFLGSGTSTLIIAHSIPISIVSTFVLLHFGNFTLNIMTLGGLALGVGRLVDDAIVVLENINRHIERGESPEEASYLGTKEVSKPVIAATITSIVVFIPLAFVKGVAALLFVQMAYTVAFSLMASLFDSLTLVPVLTAKFLKSKEAQEKKRLSFAGKIYKRTQPIFQKLDENYQNVLQFALSNRKAVVSSVVAVFAVSMILLFLGLANVIRFIGTEFFPATDESQFSVRVRLPVASALEKTQATMEQVEAAVFKEVPEIKAIVTRAGWGGPGARFTGSHVGNIQAMLVDKSERDRSSKEIADTMWERFKTIPGAFITVGTGGLVSRIMSFGSDDPIDVEILGFDLSTGSLLARDVERILRGVQGVTNIQVGREEGLPEYQVRIRQDRVATLGLTTSRVADVVQTAIEGDQSSVHVDPITGREHYVRVRLAEEDRSRVEDLRRLPIPVQGGKVVALENAADLVQVFTPTQIERKYQQRIIHVTGNISGRDFGSIAQEIEKKISQIKVPQGFTVSLKGTRQDQQEAFRMLLFALALAILLIYMVLASQFGSLLHPFLIMFSVPLGFVGVIWALFLTGNTLSVISFIGIIMMVGVVVSNAIILVDYINRLREEGVSLREAIVRAGRIRLRPIVMTTLTTICGLIPMALGVGEGAEANASLAIAVIGGLTVSTFLTLVFVPTLYFIVENWREQRKLARGGLQAPLA
jgi:hydrophobic/amphiphilic exporter-1 (mainly G- bacteria), HAE1 family